MLKKVVIGICIAIFTYFILMMGILIFFAGTVSQNAGYNDSDNAENVQSSQTYESKDINNTNSVNNMNEYTNDDNNPSTYSSKEEDYEKLGREFVKELEKLAESEDDGLTDENGNISGWIDSEGNVYNKNFKKVE